MTGAGLWRDLKIGLVFYTRLPFKVVGAIEGADLARATWANPLVGACVAVIGAMIFWLAEGLGLPPALAAALALAATLLATGCFHEDGLADMVDGFGGGWTRERKLEIMRDSRHGTYGVAALVLSLLLRWLCLASLSSSHLVLFALLVSHGAARGAIPLMMVLLPAARTEGLSAYAGLPPRRSVLVALAISVLGLLLLLGPATGLLAILALALSLLFMALLALHQIGGYTGDVLGATEQLGEIAVLLVVVSQLT